MAEDVFKVADEDLPPVCLQLIGQCADEGGACGARLRCQEGQQHLERPLHRQGRRKNKAFRSFRGRRGEYTLVTCA